MGFGLWGVLDNLAVGQKIVVGGLVIIIMVIIIRRRHTLLFESG